MGKKRPGLAGELGSCSRWPSNGGVFKRGLLSELRRLLNCVKSLKASPSEVVDETPLFFSINRRRKSREIPSIPCFKPTVDFDYDGVDEEREWGGRYLIEGRSEESVVAEEEEEEEEEESIDKKAEEFIARFYEQLHLQQQRSFLLQNQRPHPLSAT
ncbi:unnamed protein product [Spirodela intermedia]|uniref:Uncharacterized protein n=1 Tax=Spirodela intermedia TaxID=51605 RepID=A0A7I8I9P8_SPIIN|nr:unnamed protein product [Spirodela intermedia]CAA6654369.1 unnamed protein product [Spirodela intermedia]